MLGGGDEGIFVSCKTFGICTWIIGLGKDGFMGRGRKVKKGDERKLIF